jgi:glucose-6-phosphate 1-dehydrogenase
MSTPALTLVIFGASGDLTARKLVPALYNLAKKRRLPPELRVVGVARTAYGDDEFRAKMASAVREFAKGSWDEQAWREFAGRLHYVAGDASRAEGLAALKEWLRNADGGSPGRALFYLAVAPDLYPKIAENLAAVGLAQAEPPGWRRLIIEKPFGRDLASARALNQTLWRHFREDQIFRIDHYLGKETVQNILVFRFANTLFEPLWNYNYIDHVQITVSESVKVEGRGDYYDRSGVLRDMFQNHLLQLLALVAMEGPARYAADPLRNEKVKVLDAIPVYTAKEAAANLCAGQYVGYRTEKGVAPNSRTPTFAAVRLQIDNWRWRGVPFYLRSGKALARRASEVVIQFRCPPHLMFPLPPGETLQCNRLAMCIQPDEGIHLNFQSKVPDRGGVTLHESDMEFHYRTTYGAGAIPEAYEVLLEDALAGDAALFMRSDEIERAWEIMDPLIAAAERPGGAEPMEYAVGSEGPTCADAFLAKEGRRWVSLCVHPEPAGAGR